MKFKKVHIIGPAGSGKTTISSHLAEHYAIPHLNLDDIAWDKHARPYSKKAAPQIRDAELKRFMKNSAYIIEGSYYKWGFESWKNADIILFLTPPFYVTLFRLVRRYIKRRLGLEKAHHGTLKQFVGMICWNWQWYRRIPEFVTLAKKHNATVVHTKSSRDALKILNT